MKYEEGADASAVENLIILIAKQYIYQTRCKSVNPDRLSLRLIIMNVRSIEKYQAVKSNRFDTVL